MYSFIHSGYFYSTASSPLYILRARGTPDTAWILSHAKTPQVAASEGLAQGPYVAARTGFEPTTARTQGDESTNEPLRPTNVCN